MKIIIYNRFRYNPDLRLHEDDDTSLMFTESILMV